jgi:HD-like signal output (HDOD) protein
MQALNEVGPLRLDRNLEMPSVPVVLAKILQLVDEDRATARRLEELILHDPSLSVRILKLSNSAFYSFRSEVKTISHAIALLGLNLVRSLAIGVSIFEAFTQGLREQANLINQLWMHSVGVALVSQDIWNRRSTRTQGEFALLCGLLHDLGKVVYFKKDASRYSRLFTLAKGPDDPDICVSEVQDYGMDHATLGSLLTSHWHLPQELSTTVLNHHAPDAAGLPLVAAVSLADMVVKQAGIGSDGESAVTADMSRLQGLLKMDPDELQAVSMLAAAKRAYVEGFFHLL